MKETTAYKGHLIRHNPLADHRWIEKDGCKISSCASEADGYRIVDELTQPQERRVSQLLVEHERRVRAFSYKAEE